MVSMTDQRKQMITGVVPPLFGEAMIREIWPSITTVPVAAAIGEKLTRSIILAPLAWLLLAPLYFRKVMPGLAMRYTLTNRRVMIRRGLTARPTHEVQLSEIDDVRVVEGSQNSFYRAADLEILSKGQVLLRLAGVPEAESFRHAIINSFQAWHPVKAK